MSEIKEYKCPACGGAMEFDSKSQKMKCPYCDTEISVDEYESLIAKADQVVAADAASDVLNPPKALTDCGVRPRWAQTGMEASTMALI